MISNGRISVSVWGGLVAVVFVLAVVAPSEASPMVPETVSITLNSDALGLGSDDINYASNDSAVEADRAGKLVTSLAANVGSVLTIETTGLAGPGDATNPLLVTVTARTYMDVQINLPAGYDFQAGIITLTNDGGEIWKEGLGVRAFGIDLAAGPNFARRYVNPDYVATNSHGFQMEGSKEVSGGKEVSNDPDVDVTAWDYFAGNRDAVPSNSPPHVDEDVTFDFNNAAVAVPAESIKVLLTKIKAGSDEDPFDLALDLKINLVGGTCITKSYDYLSEATDVFSLPTDATLVGHKEGVIVVDFSGASLGLEATDIIDSFVIGARDDPADDPKGTDEHFLINGFIAEIPEPTTLSLLVLGGLSILARRRRRG